MQLSHVWSKVQSKCSNGNFMIYTPRPFVLIQNLIHPFHTDVVRFIHYVCILCVFWLYITLRQTL